MFRRQHPIKVRPESLICTREDEHLSTFACRSFPTPTPAFEHLPFKACHFPKVLTRTSLTIVDCLKRNKKA